MERVVLRNSRDASGTRFLEAKVDPDGTLRIEGQDLGPGVSAVFGPDLSEDEWWWSLPAVHTQGVVEAYGGSRGEAVLTVLKRWAAAHPGDDPGSMLKAAGLPISFDSRIGD